MLKKFEQNLKGGVHGSTNDGSLGCEVRVKIEQEVKTFDIEALRGCQIGAV